MDIPRKYECEHFVKSKLPNKLYEKLMPFQKEGIEFAIRKNGCCLIADEMGLGKTLQAISVAYYYKEEWPLLIIVPSSLKFCWIEELEKWLPDVLPNQINLVQCGTDASGIASSLITIVTYGLLRMPSSKVLREAIEACRFKIVICDESHYLKNHKSLSCKVIVPLIKSAQRRILLSGTPALAKPAELYSQIDAVCPKQFGTFWQFADKYCDAHTVYFGKIRKHKFDGASNLEELQKKLTSLLMIRREKSEVLTELPPKQRQRVLFELKESQLKKEILDKFAGLRKQIHQGDKAVKNIFQAVDTLASSAEEIDFNEGNNSSQQLSIFSQISELYKLSGNAKIGPVREYIEMLCDNDQLKFLVFAYHHDMMNGIEQALWEKNVKFVRIDGKTKSIDRQQCVTQFQTDQETRVAILSILAAGVGLTFTAAKLVVFAELYWTPGVMMQCEDRAHRIGQTSSLPVHYLVAKGTMDEWVWSAVCKKTVVTSTALTGRNKKLELTEGEKYQIDLLSNADIWQPEEDNGDLDISDIVQNSRPADQSSILNFFTPTKDCEEKSSSRKRKLWEIEPVNKFIGQSFAGKSFGKMFTERKGDHPSDVFVISDDEDDFTAQSLKNKPTVKKTKLTDLKSHEIKKSEKIHLCEEKKKTEMGEGRKVDNVFKGSTMTSNVFQGRVSPKSQAEKSVDSKHVCEDEGAQDDHNKHTHWACGVCTFDNHKALSQCEMCETPKKQKTKPAGEKLNNFGETSADSQQVHTMFNESIDKQCSHSEKKEEAETILISDKTDMVDIKMSLSSENEEKLPTDLQHSIPKNTLDASETISSHILEDKKVTPPPSLLCHKLSDVSDSLVREKIFHGDGNNVTSSQEPVIDSPKHSVDVTGDGLLDCPGGANKKSCADVYKCLMFSCSVYTGRIYVYNQDGTSLEASFLPTDVEMGNLSELPEFLQLPPNTKLLQKFVREWSSLTETKKRLIAKRGLKFTSPLAAYNEVKTVQGSKQRHLTKVDFMESAVNKAKNVQGSVRFICKQSTLPTAFSSESSDGEHLKGVPQTITEEGIPLCLQCHKPYSNPLLLVKTVTNPENAWQLRLCSYVCMDKYWTLTKASYCRDQIYEIEHGVCRMCQFDTDRLYNRIKVTKGVKAKLSLINKSPYSGLNDKQKQKMVESPQAGQFWHADHITPVWQGGGLCDLDNLRTLCTPCHLKVTQRQAGERATVKKLSGACNSRDITAFFQKL